MATSVHELRLLNRAKLIYDKSPAELLPPEYEVSLDDSSSMPFKDRQHRNTNWPHSFCQHMIDLITCPAFHYSVELLHHAIRLAMHHRIGVPAPTKEGISVARRDDTFINNAAMIFGAETNVDDRETRKRFLQLLGPDLPTFSTSPTTLRLKSRANDNLICGLV
jgi:hypothetical protein